MSEKICYTVAPQALFQQVAQESVLLHLGTERYFSLDEVGTRMWQLLAEHGDIEIVVAEMEKEYEASADLLRTDVTALVEKLVAAELMVREDATPA